MPGSSGQTAIGKPRATRKFTVIAATDPAVPCSNVHRRDRGPLPGLPQEHDLPCEAVGSAEFISTDPAGQLGARKDRLRSIFAGGWMPAPETGERTLPVPKSSRRNPIPVPGRVTGMLLLALMGATPAWPLTWTRVQELPATEITSLQLHGTTLYASSGDRVYQGANQGTAWTESAPVGAGGALIVTVIPAGGALWAGSFGQGVFRSPDAGATWSPASAGLAGLGATHVNEFAVRADTLYAATDGAGVFALDLASATTWKPFNTGLPVFTAGTVSAISVHGTTLVAPAGPNGLVYRLPQGSNTWQEIAVRPPLAPGFLATDLLSDGANLLVVNGSSVFHSNDDAQSWTLVGDGLVNGVAVFLAGAGPTFFAVVDFLNNSHQFYSSTDTGVSWQAIEPVEDLFVEKIEAAGDRLFAARTNGLWSTPLATTAMRAATWGGLKARFRR